MTVNVNYESTTLNYVTFTDNTNDSTRSVYESHTKCQSKPLIKRKHIEHLLRFPTLDHDAGTHAPAEVPHGDGAGDDVLLRGQDELTDPDETDQVVPEHVLHGVEVHVLDAALHTVLCVLVTLGHVCRCARHACAANTKRACVIGY